jgi:chondroitin 4-sulfotransferase 11
MAIEKLLTFIRIPKNASTSLYVFFGDLNTVRNEYLSGDNPKHLNIFESSHQSISELEVNLGSSILKKPVLAVVRNPYDRLVSMYFFAKKHGLGKIYDIDTSEFTNFAKGFYDLSKDCNFFHAMSQVDFIEHAEKDNFTVIKFEDLKKGISDFINENELSGMFDADKLESLNGTNHKHYSEYYNDETIKIVKDMWGCDLEYFSYSLENQSNRGDPWV